MFGFMQAGVELDLCCAAQEAKPATGSEACDQRPQTPEPILASHPCAADTPGLASPAGPCHAGYWCRSGATTPAPADSLCPAGGYCPEGTIVPVACPEGTFNPSPGGRNSSSCAPCSAGWYCNGTGLAAPSGPCAGGYFCPVGTVYPTLLCPVGYYCPNGSAAQSWWSVALSGLSSCFVREIGKGALFG